MQFNVDFCISDMKYSEQYLQPVFHSHPREEMYLDKIYFTRFSKLTGAVILYYN